MDKLFLPVSGGDLHGVRDGGSLAVRDGEGAGQ